jgi:hypothetical protein
MEALMFAVFRSVAFVFLMRSASSAVQFDPVYYGAVPNDGLDDAAAIRSAVAAALNAGPGNIVVLGNGAWTLSSYVGNVYEGYSAVKLDSASDLTITGSGSTVLEVTDYDNKRAFLVRDSEDITIKDLKVTYFVPPIASGEIIGWTGFGTGRVYTVQKVSSSSDFDADVFNDSPDVNAFFSKASLPTRMIPNTYQVYNPVAINNLGAGQFTLRFDKQSDQADVGDYVNLLASYGGSGVARTLRSKNVTYSNIDFSNIPGISWSGLYNENLVFENCCSIFPEDIFITSTRDIIHFGNSTGTRISNCYFSGCGDTTVNLKMLLSSAEKVDSTTIKTFADFYGEVGDFIRIIRPSTGGTVLTRVIQGKATSGSETFLTVSSFSVDIAAGDLILNEDWCHNFAVVEGNVFEHSRRQGLLIRAFDALVEDNVFRGLGDSGVCAVHQYSYNEGGRFTKSFIIDNLFDDVELCYSGNTGDNGAIALLWGTDLSLVADTVFEGHRQIEVSNNTFRNYHDAAVRVNGGYDVVVRSNTVYAVAPFLRSTNYMFYISNSSEIEITDNSGTGDTRNHTGYINLQNVSGVVTNSNLF